MSQGNYKTIANMCFLVIVPLSFILSPAPQIWLSYVRALMFHIICYAVHMSFLSNKEPESVSTSASRKQTGRAMHAWQRVIGLNNMILRGEVRVKTVVRTEKQTFDSFDVRQRFVQRLTSVSIYSSLRALICNCISWLLTGHRIQSEDFESS